MLLSVVAIGTFGWGWEIVSVLHIFIIVVYLSYLPLAFLRWWSNTTKWGCVRVLTGKNNGTKNKMHKKENDRTDNEPWSTLSSDGNTMCRVLDFSHEKTVSRAESSLQSFERVPFTHPPPRLLGLSLNDDRRASVLRKMVMSEWATLDWFHSTACWWLLAGARPTQNFASIYRIDFALWSSMMLMVVKKFSFHS